MTWVGGREKQEKGPGLSLESLSCFNIWWEDERAAKEREKENLVCSALKSCSSLEKNRQGQVGCFWVPELGLWHYTGHENKIEVVSFTVKKKIKRAGPLQAVTMWVERDREGSRNEVFRRESGEICIAHMFKAIRVLGIWVKIWG